MPQLSKPKILELSRCEWIEQKYNCCLVGSHGTGKTHVAVALGQAACRAGLRVRFFTAAELVSQLEKAQKQYTLDRFLGQLERAHLLICDELGYVSLSRGGVELLFRVFGDRYERASVLVTSNLPFSEWNQIFQGERMTAALLDRLTHHCHIFEMNGESYRFRESMKSKKSREIGVKTKLPLLPRAAILKTQVGPAYALRVGPAYAAQFHPGTAAAKKVLMSALRAKSRTIARTVSPWSWSRRAISSAGVDSRK